MRIEILHIDDCPNWQEAGVRLRAALTKAGLVEFAIDYRRVGEGENLRGAPFAGSPTILVDGRDLFPAEGATSDLACRVYISDGRMTGLPTVDDIVAALGAREVEHVEK